jgi:ribonuclease D
VDGPADQTPDPIDDGEHTATEVVRAPLLREPADGVPTPLTTSAELTELAARIRAGTGPLAVDAERASGYRYSQRAYLVQIRRVGAGTALIDPIALPALTTLNDAVSDAEWILHAANQDLPCLAELGLHPASLFDTEVAGRLLGVERVALGTMVEEHLGVRLEKGHSAADWSTRPLPYDWLSYAALDVELLVELRAVLIELLDAAGKLDWAQQEFEAIRLAGPHPPRIDPWRRTSGLHKLRSRRQLAAVRSLWYARDAYAAARDVAPGRILPDAAIIDAARTLPTRAAELATLSVFGGSRQRRQLGRWFGALEQARGLADSELPPLTNGNRDGIPPASRWRDHNPIAATRLTACRAAVSRLAGAHSVLTQNLLASDVIRQLAWEPPQPLTLAAVRGRLTELGAREWQIELTAAALLDALEAKPAATA